MLKKIIRHRCRLCGRTFTFLSSIRYYPNYCLECRAKFKEKKGRWLQGSTKPTRAAIDRGSYFGKKAKKQPITLWKSWKYEKYNIINISKHIYPYLSTSKFISTFYKFIRPLKVIPGYKYRFWLWNLFNGRFYLFIFWPFSWKTWDIRCNMKIM